MHFNGGYLTVGVDGYYVIYSQMYYFDGSTSVMGHSMYINDREVLSVISSVISSTRKYSTHYTSGIFKIMKGQRIYVGTRPSPAYYYFTRSTSFFGAFLLHHWWRPQLCLALILRESNRNQLNFDFQLNWILNLT